MNRLSRIKVNPLFNLWQNSKMGISSFCFLFSMYCIFVSAIPSIAKTGTDINNSKQPVIIKNISILPLENLTDNPAAGKIVSELIKKELKDKNWGFITKDDDVEEFLAKRRIRYTGGITIQAAREMGKTLGVDAILVGSINQFSDSNGKMNVSVTVRLVSTIEGGIIWADALSYTEHDFVGFLGLGLITSMDVLSSKVAKNLVKDITDQFFIREDGLSPFEIEKAETFPSVAKSGGKIALKVKVLTITEDPKEVKAVIDGNEIQLVKGEEGEYEGELNISLKEGTYLMDVIAKDQALSPFSFGAVGKVTIDSTPPIVNLTINRKVFAPQKRGYIMFTPTLRSFDDIDEWQIEILDNEGNMVRGDRGYGKLPNALIWRGETDKHTQVSDGKYSYKFLVKDVAGNTTVLTDNLKVRNNPPVIKVDVDKLEDKVLFAFESNPDAEIKSWKLSILDSGGKTVKMMEGIGEFPPEVKYQVDADFDINSMSFLITAIDNADNPVNLTKSISSKKTPFAKADSKGQMSEDF